MDTQNISIPKEPKMGNAPSDWAIIGDILPVDIILKTLKLSKELSFFGDPLEKCRILKEVANEDGIKLEVVAGEFSMYDAANINCFSLLYNPPKEYHCWCSPEDDLSFVFDVSLPGLMSCVNYFSLLEDTSFVSRRPVIINGAEVDWLKYVPKRQVKFE